MPTSVTTERSAADVGIPLTTLDAHPILDLAVDGADEVDGRLNLVKGGGGAFLREKIVALASRRRLIIVDEAKLVTRLGERTRHAARNQVTVSTETEQMLLQLPADVITSPPGRPDHG